MRRGAAVLLAAAAATAGEARRSDLHLWLDAEPTAIAYRISAPTGAARSGGDGFDRAVAARLGGRWTWSSPGRSWAPQFGADLVLGDAAGDALAARRYGLALAGGAAWTPADAWRLECEAHAEAARIRAEAPEMTTSPAFAVAGTATAIGLRAAAVWRFDRRWSAGAGLGWLSESADLDGEVVDLAWDRQGLVVSVGLCWRLDVRPAALE